MLYWPTGAVVDTPGCLRLTLASRLLLAGIATVTIDLTNALTTLGLAAICMVRLSTLLPQLLEFVSSL